MTEVTTRRILDHMAWRWLIAFFAGAALCAGADEAVTVHELTGLIRDAVREGKPDGKLAKSIEKLRLKEHLNDHAIEELISAGAGPKSEDALNAQADRSAGLPEPDLSADFPPAAVPATAQQQTMIDAARNHVVAYSHELPDFFCLEEVRRFENTRGSWQLKDFLEIKLTYFEHHEKYDLLKLNGKPTIRSFDSVGGAISQGEFGSLLLSVFADDSETRFRWDHGTTLRGRPANVFQFRILAAQSSYRLAYRMGNGQINSTITGQHGFVYIDAATNVVMKVIADADSIPRNFPVHQAHTVLEFGFTDVGGKPFLLPLRADVRMRSDYILTKNEVNFRSYRKFGTESTLTFQ